MTTFDLNRPYQVTTPEGTKLLVMDVGQSIPLAFALMGTVARDRVAVRIMGGCSNMSEADKAEMLQFFGKGFQGFGGVVLSGGTRSTTPNGSVDPMVTDVPGYIKSLNPESVALGTIPRVDVLKLVDESRLTLGADWNLPNPTMSGLLLVQDGPDAPEEERWDLDVPKYFSLMEAWRNTGGFSSLAAVVWNGGGVTIAEAEEAARRQWPTILVKGSGRGADQIIKKLEEKDPATVELFGNTGIIVSKNDAQQLRAVLYKSGILH